MLPEGFVVAMRGSFAFAPYGAPHRAGPAGGEWLIVCRWGLEGEYLSIARAGPAEVLENAPPPAGLRTQATFLGLRLGGAGAETKGGAGGETRAGDGEGASFLLVRHLPPGVTLAGVFHPSDGMARLTGPAGTLRLEAAGRFAHLRGERAQEEVRADVPDPPEGAAEATAWSLTGHRMPWLGEFLAQDSAAGSGSGGHSPD